MDTILSEDFSDVEDDYKFWLEGYDRQGRPGKQTFNEQYSLLTN
jgi:hypothetical protein